MSFSSNFRLLGLLSTLTTSRNRRKTARRQDRDISVAVTSLSSERKSLGALQQQQQQHGWMRCCPDLDAGGKIGRSRLEGPGDSSALGDSQSSKAGDLRGYAAFEQGSDRFWREIMGPRWFRLLIYCHASSFFFSCYCGRCARSGRN